MVVRVPINANHTTRPVVHKVREACRGLGWVVIRDENEADELYTAKLCSKDADFELDSRYWAIGIMTLTVISPGKGQLEIAPNWDRSGIEEPYKMIVKEILSYLQAAGIYQAPPPTKSKRPLGFELTPTKKQT